MIEIGLGLTRIIAAEDDGRFRSARWLFAYCRAIREDPAVAAGLMTSPELQRVWQRHPQFAPQGEFGAWADPDDEEEEPRGNGRRRIAAFFAIEATLAALILLLVAAVF